METRGHTHRYDVALTWEGRGTPSYAAYARQYRVEVEGKPPIVGSADRTFRGDPALPNPEDLFVASIAACHMLTYLALAARRGLNVLSYADASVGRMVVDPSGGGRFEEVLLRPRVVVVGDLALATALHVDAHALCFVASSCSVPIRCEPEITLGEVDV
jgi:organic hydroperoxide reductase OsmC/OhrA